MQPSFFLFLFGFRFLFFFFSSGYNEAMMMFLAVRPDMSEELCPG